MTLFRSHFDRIRRRLKAEGNAAKSLQHGLNRGLIREAFIREFLARSWVIARQFNAKAANLRRDAKGIFAGASIAIDTKFRAHAARLPPGPSQRPPPADPIPPARLVSRTDAVAGPQGLTRTQFDLNCDCEQGSVAISILESSFFRQRDRHVATLLAMTKWARVSSLRQLPRSRVGARLPSPGGC